MRYVCSFCNQLKGSDLSSIDPETGQIVALFHPRRQNWNDHFRLAGGRLEPMTEVGRVTERLLQFNQSDRVAEREQHVALGLLTTS